MNSITKIIGKTCIAILCLSCVPCMHVNGAALGQAVVDSVAALPQAVRIGSPAKVAGIIALCAVGGMVAKTLWTRYVTLRNIDKAINPEPLLNMDQRAHPVSNWKVGAEGFSAPVQIRAHYSDVKNALKTACLAGEVDVFQRRTGLHLTAGCAIYWSDVMSTIDGEIARIRRIMRNLEQYVDVTFKGLHLFGIRKNFVALCNELDITGLEVLHHSITADQANQIDEHMMQDRSLAEQLCALLLANPNYGKAYRIFWQLDQRLGRLQAIKEAVVYTPVNWSIALH